MACLALLFGAVPGTAAIGPVAGAVAGVETRPAPAVAESAPLALRSMAVRAEGDRWIAEDKARHLVASFAATGIGYGAARFAAEPGSARAGAAVMAGIVGVGKELIDVRGGGRFSVKDLAWDAVGVALGYIFVQRIE